MKFEEANKILSISIEINLKDVTEQPKFHDPENPDIEIHCLGFEINYEDNIARVTLKLWVENCEVEATRVEGRVTINSNTNSPGIIEKEVTLESCVLK